MPETASGEDPVPVTPLILFQTSDITDQKVVNLVRLLQTLDDGGNPDNGLQITTEAHNLATTQIDFDVPETTFEADATVTNLVSAGWHLPPRRGGRGRF